MRYMYQSGIIVPYVKRHAKQVTLAVTGLFASTVAVMTIGASAASLVNGCSFTQTPTVWSLDSDCTSTAQINIPTGVTLNGKGHTIRSSFPNTGNSNNASIGVQSNDVTIKNLTINGTGSLAWPTGLHGINIYVATGVKIKNVTIKNMSYSGINVNGSMVSVGDVTTSANGWSGIDVDLGSGVTTPAVLSIEGKMSQTDLAQLYVDDTTKTVTVKDKLHQYTFVNHTGIQPNDRLYTLKRVLVKDDCKKDGWKNLRDSDDKKFKNQGECVSEVEHQRHEDGDKEDDDEGVVSNYVLSSTSQTGVNVPTNSDAWYKVTISGTWTNRSVEQVDAECTSYNGGTWANAVTGGFSPDLLDVQINNGFVDWGTCDSTNHSYTHWVHGTGAPMNLRIFDGDVSNNTQTAGWFGDNVGSLQVKVVSFN